MSDFPKLTPIYKSKFHNCEKVVVYAFSPGSVIVNATAVFKHNTTVPSTSDMVRALYSKLMHTGMMLGDFSLNGDSIQSTGSTVKRLDPMIINVNLQIKDIFPSSILNLNSIDTLKNQMVKWLSGSLENALNGTLEAVPKMIFSNDEQWVGVSMIYKLRSTSDVSNKDTANFLSEKVDPQIRKSSITVNGEKADLTLYNFTLRILDRMFSESLNNKINKDFLDLQRAVTRGLTKILNKTDLFAEVVVEQFTPGSVIATVTPTYFQPSPTESSIQDLIFHHQNILKEEGLTIDPNSVLGAPSLPTVPPTERSFPSYAIAIIVLCILLIIAVPVGILLAKKTDNYRRFTSRGAPRTPYERQDSAPQYKFNDCNFLPEVVAFQQWMTSNCQEL
ncbi:taste receptor cell protein 1-like [Alligator mississippiensis]|uniref:Taste receptor cell protein 1-like n=1 Tax=Alligator mississippiensis TaxID=8496 RepID=A0A151MA09_ALLMI|nr:taste receptor cell protein 1-like [Alligator mississippiensis]